MLTSAARLLSSDNADRSHSFWVIRVCRASSRPFICSKIPSICASAWVLKSWIK